MIIEYNVIGVPLNLPSDCRDDEYVEYGFPSPWDLSADMAEFCPPNGTLDITFGCAG